MHGKRESAMGLRKLRVYTGPETESAGLSLLGESTDPHTISSDLYDVLQAYRHFRRPGA